MSKLTARTTIYLDPHVKKYLKHLAVAKNRSLSEIINNEAVELLEDFEDIQEIERRKGEPTVPFEVLLKDFGLQPDDLRN